MIPAYVINLEERKDRWNHIQTKLKNLSLDLNRINAVRGKDIVQSISTTQFVQGCLHHAKCSKYHIESFGALGCAASHIEAWKQVKTISAIFEDDADPTTFAGTGISEAISLLQSNQFDLILLGSHQQPTVKGNTLVPWTAGGNVATGTWSYMLSPFAASKLLEKVFPLDLSIDLYIQTVGLRIGYISCFKQHFFFQEPDIQHLEEKLYSQNDLYKVIALTAIVSMILYYVLQTSFNVFCP